MAFWMECLDLPAKQVFLSWHQPCFVTIGCSFGWETHGVGNRQWGFWPWLTRVKTLRNTQRTRRMNLSGVWTVHH